ncbi:MAG TPA: site-2 protease family protein [Atribacter sp.]|jgi:Zn-dependent protease/CBS domain-containing protein|uniref:Zinc metalloprotease n=1 Tax=Candidatus Atribacter allofermentans TaxID=1852833 RepID=A0A1V5SU19_9BACT|nr:site-2 protease family protein [Atribacter sp.]MDD3714241.1 site-2 protease family protein [Atribacterota bacterium]OQA58029.1 MAG: putative zinc metalloprotease Rip3 [Candidatus Atribacteria bacterium ADurb.Bin276]HHT09915.1 CBS domain-containing protein [Candidatus Atribacteria bacterium]MDI9595619.1 site-2 protease family protein [Atribacterota bacterium]HQK83008.1 site-2 protease family protein [Atribacter sp.]
MFGKSVPIIRLLGFEIKIDPSWIIVLFLMIWSLSLGVFPQYYQGLPSTTYWWMGIFGAIGLFVSIVIHELFHSLVARRFGLSIRGITLFMFGGVAEMTEEPANAKTEFYMALAGPVTSIALGMIFYSTYLILKRLGVSMGITGIFGYLGIINWALAGFNLIPAFPLDGGRILRSILWWRKKDLRWATRIASRMGEIFGFTLIFLGVFSIFRGSFVGGIWLFLIGMFLQNASQVSMQRLMISKALEGETVRRFMKPDPVTIPDTMTLKEAVEDYIYRYHYKMFPVVRNSKLVGCLTTRDIKVIPKEKWSTQTAGEVSKSCSIDNTIHPDTDATQALSLMNRTGNSRLMVVENDQLIGVITLKDLLQFFSLKMELEGDN